MRDSACRGVLHVMRAREWVHGDGDVLQLDKVSKELMKTQRQMMRGTLSDAEQEVVVGRVAELEKEAGRLRKVVKASSQPPSRAASPTPEARRERLVVGVKELEQPEQQDLRALHTTGGIAMVTSERQDLTLNVVTNEGKQDEAEEDFSAFRTPGGLHGFISKGKVAPATPLAGSITLPPAGNTSGEIQPDIKEAEADSSNQLLASTAKVEPASSPVAQIEQADRVPERPASTADAGGHGNEGGPDRYFVGKGRVWTPDDLACHNAFILWREVAYIAFSSLMLPFL